MPEETLLLEIASRLRAERERLGLTVEAFALGGGLSKLTQTRYERGERMPDAAYLSSIATTHQVDVQFVLTGRKSQKKAHLSDAEAVLLDRYRNLPELLQDHIQKTALIAWLAYQDRKGYHLNAHSM